MKKLLIILALLCTELLPHNLSPKDSHFTAALTSGYVLRQDNPLFRSLGTTINLITADGCYHPAPYWGIGAKISAWRTTTPRRFYAHEIEVPLTVYLRGIANFDNGLRLYGSLGGGGLILSPGFPLGMIAPLAEAEVGLNYSVNHRVNFTTATRGVVSPFGYAALDFRVGVAFEI